MKITKIHDLYFKEFVSKNEISSIVNELATQVKNDLPENEVPLFIGILNGCFVFAADFVRAYRGNCEISFVKLASYEGISSTDKVKKLIGVNENLEGRTVVILEDIIDTGLTIDAFIEKIRDQNPASLKVCALLSKPEVNNDIIPVDYLGKEIPPSFVIGYGLDINGYGRHLKDIYQLKS